jgi:lipopolysaccharide/colanic/teichoic acid biosynthesis glycosyltransferase
LVLFSSIYYYVIIINNTFFFQTGKDKTKKSEETQKLHEKEELELHNAKNKQASADRFLKRLLDIHPNECCMLILFCFIP